MIYSEARHHLLHVCTGLPASGLHKGISVSCAVAYASIAATSNGNLQFDHSSV